MLREALTDAVHNRGYAALQHLAQAALALLPQDNWIGCAALYAAALADDAAPRALRQQAESWVQATRAQVLAKHPAANRQAGWKAHARPRLAYLVSQPHHDALLKRVVAAHDPNAVEVHLFSHEVWPDVPSHVQRHPLNGSELAAVCKRHEIDVVIDTGGVQPFAGQWEVVEALARRVAPVQVGWIGCLASSGGLFDVLLADDVSVPPGDETLFSERVERLKGGQWCWSPPRGAPPVTSSPCLTRGHVTLGVVGRSLRQGPQFLGTLAAVLAANPTLLVCVIGKAGADVAHRQSIEHALAQVGAATDRVSFWPWTSRQRYWQWLGDVDLVLDTCPASGGLSLLDALWMGVPVVTCSGAVLGSRQAASMLNALGLASWVAQDANDLVRLTSETVRDRVALQASRMVMRERWALSPLVDGGRVARQIEALAWQAHNA